MAKVNCKSAFGHRLRHLRETRGMTQEGLAQAAGLDRSYLGSVERGERNIRLENICKLAASLKVRTANLMDIDDG